MAWMSMNVTTGENAEESNIGTSAVQGTCLQGQKEKRATARRTGLGAETCTPKAGVSPTWPRRSVVACSEILSAHSEGRGTGIGGTTMRAVQLRCDAMQSKGDAYLQHPDDGGCGSFQHRRDIPDDSNLYSPSWQRLISEYVNRGELLPHPLRALQCQPNSQTCHQHQHPAVRWGWRSLNSTAVGTSWPYRPQCGHADSCVRPFTSERHSRVLHETLY